MLYVYFHLLKRIYIHSFIHSFYSLIKVHKKTGGKSSDALIQRAVVEWTLPHPTSCPKTKKQIVTSYTDSDPKNDLSTTCQHFLIKENVYIYTKNMKKAKLWISLYFNFVR